MSSAFASTPPPRSRSCTSGDVKRSMGEVGRGQKEGDRDHTQNGGAQSRQLGDGRTDSKADSSMASPGREHDTRR